MKPPSLDSFCKSFNHENLKYNKAIIANIPWYNNDPEIRVKRNPAINIKVEIAISKGQRDDSKIIKGVDRDFSQLLNFTYNHTCFHEDLISINSSVYLTLNKLQNWTIAVRSQSILLANSYNAAYWNHHKWLFKILS